MLNEIINVNEAVKEYVWGIEGISLLIGTGIIMTVLTKFFQITHLKHWWNNTIGSLFNKNVIGHSKDKGAISPFQALCTALAATVGTGNIAGVAAAICTGGAGAIFWMWIAAFFGMMTNYSENVLGIFYRRRNKTGEWAGGAMYYIQDGLGSKKGMSIIAKILAVIFGIFTLLASFGIGAMGQVNKIVANITSAFEIEAIASKEIFEIDLYSFLIGAFLVIIASLIILGGIKRIASVAEKIIPVMVIAFVMGCITIICINYANIIPAFKAIVINAFKPISVIGGGVGVVVSKVMTQGFKRGVFSNEAGLGSSVMVHCNSNIKEPVKQGMWGIFEVFADTMVVCTMTALVILTSGAYNLETGAILEGYTDATLVAGAFSKVFPWGGMGEKFIAIAMFLFAFTTVLGWSHYGTKAWEYLFGEKTSVVYKVLHIFSILLGAIVTSSLAWDISDTFNGLMMIPNLIGVLVLSPLVVKITKNYIDRYMKNKDIKPMRSYDENIEQEYDKDNENS